MTAQAVQPRPTPIRPSVDSLLDLYAYLVKRIANFRVDFEDDETAASIGIHKQNLSRGRVMAFEDVRSLIRDAVEAEIAESVTVAHEESVESQYREAYGPEPLAPWQAEDR